jgi:predicted O-methyltransferase YrrM
MGQIVPPLVERYLASLNRLADPLLDDLRREGESEGLPIVNAEVGALLLALATARGVRRVLEIGTAIGYSTIWLARALPPGGMLISLEIDAARAARARRNLDRAGLADRASVMIGDADRIVHKLAGPFDLIFNDGDKRQYPRLLDRLVERLSPRGVLVTDNVLWDGEVVPGLVAAPARPPDDTRAIAEHNERLAADPRLITAWVPIRDGLAIAVKRA